MFGSFSEFTQYQITTRCCWWLADLISLLSSLYFLKHPNFPKEPHLLHFTILSQKCPYVILDIVLLSAVPPLKVVLQALFYCWALVSTCYISACQLFLDIKCLWVNLVCPNRILLSLTLYCLQLLYALYHSSMCSLIQCSLIMLLSHSLFHS